MINLSHSIRLVCTKTFYVLAFLIFGWCYLSGFHEALGRKWLIVLSLILFAAIVGLGCYLIYRWQARITSRMVFGFVALGLCCMALVQYKLATLFMVDPTWDFGAVFTSAVEFATTGTLETYPHYFEQFPNNWGLMACLTLFFRMLFHLGITATSDFLRAGVILNCVVIDASVVLLIIFCKKVWGNAAALIALGLNLLFTPFYLYVPIFYTDAMSLLFPPLALLLLYAAQHCNARWTQLLLYLLLGIVLSLGAKIKGSLAVLLIAFVVYLFLQVPFRRSICGILALVISFGCFSAAFDARIKRSNMVNMDVIDAYQFPKEFWLYMGLNNPGGFNSEDFTTICAEPTMEEKRTVAQEGIQQRLQDYGVSGLFRHLTQKLGYTFGDGGYFIWAQLHRSPLKATALSDYFYAERPNNYIYLSISGGYHFLLGLIMIVGLLIGVIKETDFSFASLCYLILLGIFLFLMLWETRSRYLFNVTPVMLIACTAQLSRLFGWFTAHTSRQKTA